MKFPTMDEFAQMVADKAIDEVEYNGKTLREWVEIISAIPVTAIPATDINVATKVGTNLAEVGTDLISRKAAIEAVGRLCDGCDNGGWCGECRIDHPDKDAIDVLEGLPPIQPDKDKVSDLLYHIYSIQSPHLDVTGVVAKKYYCEALWKELFGKESELPKWMT